MLACSAHGDTCRWFRGVAPPADWTVSRCAADDVCCQSDWPFASVDDTQAAYTALYTMGLEPWSADRALSVSVEASSGDDASRIQVECTPTDRFIPSPCGEEVVPVREAYPSTFVELFPSTQGGATRGWQLFLEVHPELGRARACRVHVTDAIQRQCPAFDRPECATSGTVRVGERAGEPSVVSAELAFEDGLRIRLLPLP